MAGSPVINIFLPPLDRSGLDALFTAYSGGNGTNPRISRIKFKTFFPIGFVYTENYIVTPTGYAYTVSSVDSGYRYLPIGGVYFIRFTLPTLTGGQTLEGDSLYVSLAKSDSTYSGGFKDITGANSTEMTAALNQFATYMRTNYPAVATSNTSIYKNDFPFELLGATTGSNLGASALVFKVRLSFVDSTGGGGGNTSVINI